MGAAGSAEANITVSRRGFTKGAAAMAIGAAAAGGTTVWLLGRNGSGSVTPYAFRIDHGDDIQVLMTNGERFLVTVRRREGTELERFEDVTASSLLTLESEYVTLSEIPVPTAA
jgi:hypothetical protein